jgi:hypothetical protein
MVEKRYMGIQNDPRGAMHATGNIIRDAWVFGLIPETETCEGWTGSMVDALYDKVTKEWEKYGLLVSNLPPELRERHQRIYDQAVAEAQAKGWDPELDDDEV